MLSLLCLLRTTLAIELDTIPSGTTHPHTSTSVETNITSAATTTPSTADTPSHSSTPSKRKKSKSNRRIRASKVVDLPAEDSSFIEFAKEDDEDHVLWAALVKWELTDLGLGQGQVNTIYRQDGSYKHFTFLS